MSAVKKTLVVEQLRRHQMVESLAQRRRLDGRELLEYRPITIETGLIQKANGSARVSIGNTQVIAGVKVEVGKPFPDTPNQGLLIVNTEVLPLSSPYAEPGPPDEDAIELARVVDRGIRAADMLDLQKLVIRAAEQVYAVFADVSVLNVDGNLIDTTSLAVVAALATGTMSEYHFTTEGKLEKTETVRPLVTKTLPVSVTMARIGDAMIVDPTAEEEAVMDARITLTTDSEGHVVAGQKGNPGGLSVEHVHLAAGTARTKGAELRSLLQEAIRRAAR